MNKYIRKYCLTITLIILMFINSCSYYKYNIEEKLGKVTYFEIDHSIAQQPLAYTIDKHPICNLKNNYFINEKPPNNLVRIEISQRLKCNEYIADEYAIKEITRINPFNFLGFIWVLSFSPITIPLFGKDEVFKRLDNFTYGEIIDIKNIDKKYKRVEKTGNVQWKTFPWKNGKLIIKTHKRTYIQNSNENGVILLNLSKIINENEFSNKTFTMHLFASTEEEQGCIKLDISDHVLYQIEFENVDMSYAKTNFEPFGETKLQLKNNPQFILKNGDNDTLFIFVKNTGKGAFYQLKSILKSKSEIFDKKELNIGRILPGETKGVRYAFQIPKNMLSTKIPLQVVFNEANGYEPEKLEQIITINGEKPPKLIYGYRILEDNSGNSFGNSDGIISHRESVDIYLSIKNIGEGTAENTRACVTIIENTQDLRLNINQINLGNIRAGELKEDKFTITPLLPFNDSYINLILNIEEDLYKTRSKNIHLSIPFLKEVAPKSINLNKKVSVRAKTNIIKNINSSSTYFKSFKKETIVDVIGELFGWYQITIPNNELSKESIMEYGWINKVNVVSEDSVSFNISANRTDKILYRKESPIIYITNPKKKKVYVQTNKLRIKGLVTDEYGIHQIQFYVNNKLYYNFKPIRKLSLKEKLIDVDISLINGENIIRVNAINIESIPSEETIIVNK